MPLRRCQQCDGPLPAGSTGRAKFCSARCRVAANRAKGTTPLTVAPDVIDTLDDPASSSRREALERAVSRLDRLLDESDPRSAAPLNKEYRETLRELEALTAAEHEEERAREGRTRERRPFSASAI